MMSQTKIIEAEIKALEKIIRCLKNRGCPDSSKTLARIRSRIEVLRSAL